MKNVVFILYIFLPWISFSQEVSYVSPVKIPIYLSGSFAELRSNHFHSGIDIKTQQRTGLGIYAVADGFISRIVVSPGGFGLALYLDHPNGQTSVYAHLQKFRDDIKDYVKDIQYERESFNIDIKVPEDQFRVNRGDLIGLSGNSGSSGGPHLHFEIRDTKSEEPLNPLQFDFPVADNTAPKMYSIMIVPLNEFSHVDYQPKKKAFPVRYQNGRYHVQDTSVISAYGNVGIAVEANDFFDGSANRCGIYSMKLWFDGELYYSAQMDRFSFDESRYINSYIDYAEYITTKRRYQKTWIDPGNRLSIYDHTQRGGNLKLTDGNLHPVKIELRDLNGNTASIEFNLLSRYQKIERKDGNYTQYMSYDEPNDFSNDEIELELAEETLYDDLKFSYKKINFSEELFSEIHVIHNNTVPLHKNAILSFKADHIDSRYHEKLLVVHIDTITGKLSTAGGRYDEGNVVTAIRSFGNYALTADTVPPLIVPLSFKTDGELKESSRIRFRITDNLSGIKEYHGTLDGEWALFEYDAKTNTIVHYFDPKRFKLGKRHTLVLQVTDHKDNMRTYETSFWK